MFCVLRCDSENNRMCEQKLLTVRERDKYTLFPGFQIKFLEDSFFLKKKMELFSTIKAFLRNTQENIVMSIWCTSKVVALMVK